MACGPLGAEYQFLSHSDKCSRNCCKWHYLVYLSISFVHHITPTLSYSYLLPIIKLSCDRVHADSQ